MKYFIFLLLTAFQSLLLCAQKLPHVQTESRYFNKPILIDGNNADWGQMGAKNSATGICYTIANDENTLYFIAQATDHTIVNKILGSGIVLSIKSAGNSAPFEISYPVLDFRHRVWVNLTGVKSTESQKLTDLKEDTMAMQANKQILINSKYIRTQGIKGIDSMISIYNRDGIKAFARFNNKMVYTYELSINLKLLELTSMKMEKVHYTVRIPGVDVAAVYREAGQGTMPVGGGWVIPTGKLPGFTDDYIRENEPSLPFKIHPPDFTTTTYFSGEYSLVKKNN